MLMMDVMRGNDGAREPPSPGSVSLEHGNQRGNQGYDRQRIAPPPHISLPSSVRQPKHTGKNIFHYL